MSIIEQLASMAKPVLNAPYIRRLRRNHAYEHATIHMLNRQKLRLSGRSDIAGFVLYGDVPTGLVERAAEEALRRMRGGERQLAIHPNCGTNLATAGLMTTLVALVGFRDVERKSILDRFPWVMLIMMLAVILSQPIGNSLQEHFTTEGDPGDLELVSVERGQVKLPFGNSLVIHTVLTKGG